MPEEPEDRTERVLRDFRAWLDGCPEEIRTEGDGSAEAGTAPDCDLHAVFCELAALRQEVRLQNREQARLVRELGQVRAEYERATGNERGRAEDLAALEARVRAAAEGDTLGLFFDVRDALVRGRRAAAAAAAPRGLFRRPPAGTASVVEGYDLAIQRFDRALSRLGVKVLPALGCSFDPERMQAVGTRHSRAAADGEVIEEVRGGFTRGGQVLRPAEVIVNGNRGSRPARWPGGEEET